MKRNLLAIGLSLLCSCCMAWGQISPSGSRSSGIGSCSVAIQDFWSIINNPAGLSGLNDISIGISYENRFSMKELSNLNAAFAIPFDKIGNFGVAFNRFGFSDYSENMVGIVYARDLGPYIKIGLKLDYLWFDFSNNYEKRRSATFELGIQSNITEKLCVGTYIFNPINVGLNTLNKIKIPIVFRVGVTYFITDEFMATTEFEYHTDSKLNYRIGLEYNVIKGFFIRTGFHTKPATACIGAGYSIKWFTIDIAVKANQYTGVSYHGSVLFRV